MELVHCGIYATGLLIPESWKSRSVLGHQLVQYWMEIYACLLPSFSNVQLYRIIFVDRMTSFKLDKISQNLAELIELILPHLQHLNIMIP